MGACTKSPRVHITLALSLTVLLCGVARPASAETGVDESEWLPSFRIVGGLSIYPDAMGPSGVFALTGGARLQVAEMVGVSGEIGWNYIAGTLPDANYLSVSAGMDLGNWIVQVGPVGTLLVGSSADALSIGGRASVRAELLAGVLGLELGYEGREILGILQNGFHISAALDVGVLLYGAFGVANFLS